jgi:hypothetical protein
MPGDKRLVPCLVEGCGREFSFLPAHIKKMHGMSATEYKAKYNTTELGDMIIPPKPGTRMGGALKKYMGPVIGLMETLLDSEKTYFDYRFKQIFESAQQDKDLEATVRDIVFSELMIMRYQARIGRKKEMPPSETKLLHGVCAQLQAANAQTLKELNLTLEKKHLHNKSPETTADRMVTAYAMAVSLMTPNERARQAKDEDEAMRRLKANADDLKKLVPTGGYLEVDDDGFETDE